VAFLPLKIVTGFSRIRGAALFSTSQNFSRADALGRYHECHAQEVHTARPQREDGPVHSA
jgi:hypothetical protein